MSSHLSYGELRDNNKRANITHSPYPPSESHVGSSPSVTHMYEDHYVNMDPRYMPSTSSSVHPPGPNSQWYNFQHRPTSPEADQDDSSSDDGDLDDHMLTIYMQDRRFSTPEHFLAEINVPLTTREDRAGWWVSSKKLLHRLQSTPSRIDGEAKVSIQRGKYKHCFVRIQDQRFEKPEPAALQVSIEKSLELVLDHIPPPTRDLKRKISQDEYSDEGSPSSSSMKRSRTSTAVPNTPAGGMPSPESLKSPTATTSTYAPTPKPPTPIPRPKIINPRLIKKSDANPIISAYVQEKIRMSEPDAFEEFNRCKGRVLPVAELLQSYDFAARIIKTYNDTRTPIDLEGAPNKKISKANVLTALGRQTSWGCDCELTLELLKAYGPSGRKEHEKIVELVEGRGEKEGSGFLLVALKTVDRAWKAGGRFAADAVDLSDVGPSPGAKKRTATL